MSQSIAVVCFIAALQQGGHLRSEPQDQEGQESWDDDVGWWTYFTDPQTEEGKKRMALMRQKKGQRSSEEAYAQMERMMAQDDD